jgi:hypothetical protein
MPLKEKWLPHPVVYFFLLKVVKSNSFDTQIFRKPLKTPLGSLSA